MKTNTITAILLLISFLVFSNESFSQPSTGENMKRLTFYQDTDFGPTWDPRGTSIAYSRLRESSGTIFEAYKVDSSNQGGEQPLLTGPLTDFGVAVGLNWIGSTGSLAVEETISGYEVLKFDTSFAPFNRTTANGSDEAATSLLAINGGGGNNLAEISRDGSTALVRFSTTGSGGNITIRVGPVSSMTGQAISTFGTVLINQNVGADPRFQFGASLTPDGSSFVIPYPTVGGSVDPHDLLIGSTAGGTLTNLTNSFVDRLTNIRPDISPDGKRIVFARGENGSNKDRDLYLINIDGTGLTQLTNTPNFSEDYPSWSPDGTAIAFSGIHTGDTTTAPALQPGEKANHNIYLLQLPAATAGTIVTPKTKLTDPPFVEIGPNNITFTLAPFVKALKKAVVAKAAVLAAKNPDKNVKYTFQYSLEVLKAGGKKKDIIGKNSKKNEITIKNLKPGNYNAKYRVEIFKKENGKNVPQGKTGFSPSAAFTVL